MPIPKSQQRAVNNYIKRNYDRFSITAPKGTKDVVQEHAASMGESINSFVSRAIKETMLRDKERKAGE